MEEVRQKYLSAGYLDSDPAEIEYEAAIHRTEIDGRKRPKNGLLDLFFLLRE